MVDGVLRDPVTLWFHEQSAPFPGGHRYEVLLCDPRTREFFSGLSLDVRSRLDSRTTEAFLQRLYWTFPAATEGGAWEFVLNTIDTVEEFDETIRVTGECSRFVRR